MLALCLLSGLLSVAESPPLSAGEKISLWPSKTVPLAANPAATEPHMVYFAPKAPVPSQVAVIVCPGGGYGHLANGHEGQQVAEYFNKLGMHVFVLQYRIVGKNQPRPLGKAPMLDVQRAIRYVRTHAEKYHLDPQKIGIMGFSAGGHLASTAGTHFDEGQPMHPDAVERSSCRPDFLILAYPVISMELGTTHAGSRRNLLGDKPTAEEVLYFSNDKQVTQKTPPTFIFQTNEDKAVPAENAVGFYLACRKHQIPVELHIYQSGQHGVGMYPKTKNTATNQWQQLLTGWLDTRGLLKPRK